MPIEAPIEDLGLFDLFQLISLTDKRGILDLNDNVSGKKYILYFQKGCLSYIDITNRLKREFCKRDLMEESDVASIKGDELIDYILEKRLMTPNTFSVFFKQVAEEVIYSLFSITAGYFSFQEVDFDIPESLDLEMRIENIIMEAARRMDEISKMKETISSRDIILEVSSDISEKDTINLDPMEWKILSLLNGQRTIADLISEIGEDFAVLKSLYGMIMTGIITEKRIEIDNFIQGKEGIEKEVDIKIKETSRRWKKGQYEEGLKVLRSLKGMYPNDPRIIYELGYYYLAIGKYSEAIAEWNVFILLSDDNERKKEIGENLEMVKELQKRISNREVFI